jgi:CubicO group peptidase (beta-lactamase class C family)
MLPVALAIMTSAARVASAEPADKALAAQVDQLFAKCNNPGSPGCAVGIIRDGKLIYAKGFGSANLDYEVANTPKTIFDIASASKAFTSACLALLMDQGKIDPDDDLRKFIPEMHKFEPPIRIQDMVRCRSGLWDQFHIMPLAGWDNVPNQSPYSEADLLTVLFGQKKLPFAPGTQFHYGSGDYVLLGLVVKRVTGQSLAEFARENLFEPLGMTRTYFQTDPTRVGKNRSVGYQKIDGTWRQWRVNAYLAGGAGVKSCVEDLYRWDQNFYASRLPKRKYMDEFIREGTLLGNRYILDVDAYLKEVQQHPQNPPAGEYRGLKRIQFTGGLWGMTAGMSRFPEQRFTVICLSNSDEIVAFSKAREIADLYLADVLKPTPAEPYPDEPKEFLKLPADELEKKTGDYRLVNHGHIWKLVVKDGDLHLIDYLGRASRLKALSATRFRPVGETPLYKSARFLFKPESDEYPVTLETNENGVREVINFNRVNLVDLSPKELREFAGEYFSEELAASYQFAVKEGRLWLVP